METDPQLIREWYKAVKQNSACITCQREGLPAEPGKVEFHHIDRSSKCDTLSNMAIRPLIPCLQYTVKPVTFALELMKVAPMCPEHHKELHRTEDKGDWQASTQRFNLTGDPFYQDRISEFRSGVMDLAPPALLTQIYDGMMELLLENQPVANDNRPELQLVVGL